MKKLKSNEIRMLWLNFFKSKNHLSLPPASLIPLNDPSLLWINSGISTIKQYFDGTKTPPQKRLTNIQNCIRTNDIDNVGYTFRHHTLFEMLGNFSIGDYFKKESIEFAWEFLTNINLIGINKNKLYVTIYNEDKETYNIWKNLIGLKKNQIIIGDKNTNFWEIGKGPCGPNTEIFFDRGLKYDIKNLGIDLLKKNIENNRYIEIWNIVFSQFNNIGNNKYIDLPQKNIDTGAGLERIASILQNTLSNFETDLFFPIIKDIEKLTNNKYKYYYKNDFDFLNNKNEINIFFRIISDHIRAITFCIADGIFPGNKDRSYIIRKLIRRSIVFGKKLNINKPFLYILSETVIKIMSIFYNYLLEKKEIIKNTIKNEEIKFFNILKKGKILLENIFKKNSFISKELSFNLYESYGLPIEYIIEETKKFNIKIDIDGFYEKYNENKYLSKNNRDKNIKSFNLQNNLFLKISNINSEFIGYDIFETKKSKIIFLFKNFEDENEVNFLENENGYLILDKTPFFAEQGGQKFDHGLIKSKNSEIEIINVKLGPNKKNIHYVKVKGKINNNELVKTKIDFNKRILISKNHSATHLLHSSLRKLLGKEIMQIGSYNDENYLRIDISYNKNITEYEIEKIEKLIIKIINLKIECKIIFSDFYTAIKKYKALAFFAEKYNKEKVRIISFGNYSNELCCGTHIKNTFEIENFLITNFESKGNGVWRISALTTNEKIFNYLKEKENKIKNEILFLYNKYKNEKIKLIDLNLEKKIKKINKNRKIINKKTLNLFNLFYLDFKQNYKDWSKKNENYKIQLKLKKFNNLIFLKEKDKNILINFFYDENDEKFIKILLNYYRNKEKRALIFFINYSEENNYKIFVGVSNDLKNIFSAKKFILNINNLLKCKGGGTEIIAQAGFKNKFIMNNIILKNVLNYF